MFIVKISKRQRKEINMGSVGNTQTKEPFSFNTNSGRIVSSSNSENRLAEYLTNLDRPLKKSEFTLKSTYVGSRLQGGMQYGYRIIPPSGFP